ncbi:MAG TPA: tRNA epoxyqueuosine(34) reductase QueG [Vicinamibacterales bacterium]|nr:tRNA epoxyqueuosine(34) reductase QueG [Vicinamibacterales bacterium]
MLTSEAIKQQAHAIGFDLCGVAPAADFPELNFFSEWIARGYAGEMDYLEKSADVRADIRRFLPTAKSVIVMGTIYNTDQGSGIRDQGSGIRDQGSGIRDQGSGPDAIKVARYARGQDYHKVIEDRLLALIEWMKSAAPQPFDAAHFVDKHQVQERVYAHHSGIGWIGKNSCVINPELGSWMFLSGIATSLDLQSDAPALDQCGSCTLCIDSCPTGAIVDAREVDATKCISYLTIETEGEIPEPQRAHIGQHAWGCDICQDVCPWNLAPAVTVDPVWQGPRRNGLSASELWERSDDELHAMIKGSAMTYVPLSRLRRNLATIIGNQRDATLTAVLDRPGHGVRNAARAASTPAVRDAIAWAKQRVSEQCR